MNEFEIKENYLFDDLVLLVELLRDKDKGCPWDKTQTHESIRQNFIEEVYEAADAIDKKNPEMLEEELGDVLLQILLHAQMSKEEGTFDISKVIDGICTKLVLRHPHIFKGTDADTSAKVLKNWEDIKRAEKAQKTGSDAIDDVPASLPPLMKSQKVQKRAAYVGFDYPSIEYALGDLDSEVRELKEAISRKGDIFEEIGDLIFSAVNIARLSEVDAELALDRACEKFRKRFKEVEKVAEEEKINFENSDIDTLNYLWEKAKKETK